MVAHLYGLFDYLDKRVASYFGMAVNQVAKSKKVVIGVIGAGSIGSLFGGYLSSIPSEIIPVEVIFFCRRNHAEMISKNGLKLHTTQEILRMEDIKAYYKPDMIEERMKANPDFQFDYMFLTTKAHDSKEALKQHEKIISKCRFLIILQNGIGNEEVASEFFPKKRIIRIVTSNGALMTESGHVIHTGTGFTKLGIPFIDELLTPENEAELKSTREGLNLLNDLINMAGIEASIVDDIIKECWEKVFINIGINPFGALTRLTNGALLEDNTLTEIMKQAVQEAVKISEIKGITLPKRDYVSAMIDVANKTAENKNSMLQDVLKRKKTEIDFINGMIVKMASDIGVKVPVNELVTCLIKNLEKSYLFED